MIQKQRNPRLRYAWLAAVPLAAGLMICGTTKIRAEQAGAAIETPLGTIGASKEYHLGGSSYAKLNLTVGRLDIGTDYWFRDKTGKPLSINFYYNKGMDGKNFEIRLH